jgi:HPt (histidine-containing phosphotransfer) domain-containing protein
VGSLDLNLINDLRELMEDEFNSLIEIYLNDSVVRMQQLELAVQQKDGTQIRHAAHSLKGSSSNIGAEELAAQCQKLEEMGKNNELENITGQAEMVQQELTRVQAELKTLMV